MQWKNHFRRIAVTLIIASIVLASLVKLLGPASDGFKTPNINGVTSVVEKQGVSTGILNSDPCKQTQALEWALEEFGLQGCWVVQTYKESGLRILLMMEESEEFRKLFKDVGPNRLIPILGHALSHPQDFKLFITEDKALEVATVPLRAAKKRWDAGREVLTNGGSFTDAAHAAMQSSGVTQTTLKNVRKEYTPEETVILLLYLIEKGQGRFLDQFHFVRNEKGVMENIEIEYVKHGLHMTTSWLTDGMTNFEKKYRWEKVTRGDVGWALLDAAFFVAPVYKIARIAKVAKTTEASKMVVTTTKANKIAKIAKAAKVMWFTAAIGTGAYAMLHPWKVINAASNMGVWLLNWIVPEWMAHMFGPFFGIFLALILVYALAWPLIVACRATRGAVGVILFPLTSAARWLYPRRA